MKSFFNQETGEIKTDNTIYNIINTDDPKYVFLYGLLLVIFLFVFSKIDFNTNLLIGLLFASILIYYIYTYREYNILGISQKKKEKFELIHPSSNILEKYPEIVDILFYMADYKNVSIPIYLSITNDLEYFCKIYEYCLIDNNLTDSYFSTLVDTKLRILNNLNNFVFNSGENAYDNKLIEIRKSVEKTLNTLLDNLILLNKQSKYYKGYNIKSAVINYNNVLPSNIMNGLSDMYRNDINISNLLFF
jgi:hypothetical protein